MEDCDLPSDKSKVESTSAILSQQPFQETHIADFRLPISWLAESNSTLPAGKWLEFQTWIWSNREGWWRVPYMANGTMPRDAFE